MAKVYHLPLTRKSTRNTFSSRGNRSQATCTLAVNHHNQCRFLFAEKIGMASTATVGVVKTVGQLTRTGSHRLCKERKMNGKRRLEVKSMSISKSNA